MKNSAFFYRGENMFIAITHYKSLDSKDINHFMSIAPHIDYLLIRTPMSYSESAAFVDNLIRSEFPRNKILIHTRTDLLEEFGLSAIHFRENDENASDYKKRHPEVSVSMSTHSALSVKNAQSNGLDFVLFGHIFETPSKRDRPPRREQEVADALSFDIPVIALGGINDRTIHELPGGFSGIAAISFFLNANPLMIETLRKEWKGSNST